MLPGVFQAKKKNGTIYYRSNFNHKGKHISLGSFATEQLAHDAYKEAQQLLQDFSVTPYNYGATERVLSPEKQMLLINLRDNGIYIKNPIYLHKGYFSYFLTPAEEYKFDIDDLFYYSSHKILKRQGHLYVNDYGMQCSILSRYGIKPYAVAGRDYLFANGDSWDYRYANIIIKNRYHGVVSFTKAGVTRYKTLIHLNGYFKIGTYASETKAAIAYNKAADLAHTAGIDKNFPENYIEGVSPKEYADLYTAVKISKKYTDYLANRSPISD